jgi:hypothetical protein
MITITVKNTRYSLKPDGTPNRITLVTWTAEKVDETVVAVTSIRGTVIAEDYAPADAAYDTLTEAGITGWVTDIDDMVSVEAQLDEQLSHILTPVSSDGVPWQESFDIWAINVAYAIGDVRIYKDIGYEVIQAHTSLSTWSPPATPSLWKLYVPASEGPQPWVQPLGAEDAYDGGVQVTHVGKLWSSLVNANVWEPGVSQWEDLGVYP